MPVNQKFSPDLRNDSPPLPTFCTARVLAANTAELITVPSDAGYVIISGNAALVEWYTNIGATATVPAADESTGIASFLNLSYASVVPGSTFSIISPNAGVVTFAWYLPAAGA